MKPILYRVETYIVPEVENLINKIDNLKIAKQFNIKNESIVGNNTQNEEDASSNASYNTCEELTRFPERFLVKDITDENDTQLDEYYDNDIVRYYNNNYYSEERLNVQKTEFQASIGPEEALYPAKQFSRINSLMSIDEKSENSLDTKLNDFCRHGYKNGCTASIPSPEEVSEEIFRDNWLQKIEILRDRETILREKEMNLQKRERELFRKEKELRIMERILNDKMKQVDQQLKYQKDMLVEKKLEEAARILSSDVEKSDNFSEEKIPKKDVAKKEDITKQEVLKKDEISRKIEIPKKAEILKRTEIPKKTDILSKKVEVPKDAQSIVNSCERKEESNKKIIHPIRSSSRKSSFSRTHSYATIRYKERSKANYEDLNSTLSAASIDSPNKRTSKWFNSALYKKPHAFTRSASERRTRHKNTTEKLQKIEETLEHVIEEDKIFRKVSGNICALQEKETRFQDYGLVDCIPGDTNKMERNSDNEEKLSSYLDIEIGEKRSHRSLASVYKDRPVSWTSETNEWLQKKRQMHDLASKQLAENKENKDNKENKCNKRYIAETICTKNAKSKKFFLFR